VHVDFVIKFLHSIRAWAPSDNEHCHFWARFEGGKLDCLFSIEQLTERWLFASRHEDRLDGIFNYLQWKVMMSTILRENKIWSFVNTIVVPSTNPITLDLYEVKEAKAQRLILDGVKDHLMPHLAEKKTINDMWDALKNLYEAKNENRKIALKNKPHDTKMGKGESVSSYLTRVAQVKNALSAVGEVISDLELVMITLKSFTKE
jgi:hypothetical protein